MTPLLEAFDLQVIYGRTVALHISHLALYQGEVLALIGPNGAGKSTLLRVLATLQKPSTGRLVYRGEPISWRHTLPYRRRIAVVMQDPLLLDMSVYANVALGWRFRGHLDGEVRERVQKWLDRFRVSHLASQPAWSLSGGEARRVALARAFVLDPDILFLDEPFSGLDVPTREDILPDLRRVLRETGTTTVLVTHDRDEALALADRVAVLMDGRIRQVGTPRTVFARPVDLDVAGFVGVENVLPAQLAERTSTRVRIALSADVHLWSTPPTKETTNMWACIRPEHVQLFPDPSRVPGENAIPGRIVEVVPLGSRVRVRVQAGGVVIVAVLGYAQWVNMHAQEGDRIWMFIAPEDIHLLAREE